MVNINLVTDGKNRESIGSGVTGLFVLLLLVLGLYAFLVFYGKSLDKKADSLKLDYDSKRSSLVVGDSKKILDFQNRLTLAKESMTKERDMKQDIGKVEEALAAGVYLNGYVYDDATKSIALDCYSDSYESVARQILSFKSSDYFLSVLAGETKLDTKSSRVSFPIILTIK
jgi:hypothetical protein